MTLPTISLSPTWLAFIISMLTALGSAYAYSTHLEQRITAVETRQADDAGHLKHIDDQVDRLVEWALGKK